MNLTQALDRAMREDTLADALTFLAVWETERVVVQARANEQWDTCFKFLFKRALERWPHEEAARAMLGRKSA